MLTFLALFGCTGASQPDLQIGAAPAGASTNPGTTALFSAVIGQDVQVLPRDGTPFVEPISLAVVDSTQHSWIVTHRLDADGKLWFVVPPGIASGTAQLEATDEAGLRSGAFSIRRLGAVANHASGEILIFDTDHPKIIMPVALDAGLSPEEVAASADGRFLYVTTSEPQPTTLTLDLTTTPVSIASAALPTRQTPSAIGVIAARSVALLPNFGDQSNPGTSLEFAGLTTDGKLDNSLGQLPVGTATPSRPFGLAIADNGDMALVTNRFNQSLSRIDLRGCTASVSPACAAVENLSDSRLGEPAGVAIAPGSEFALVVDYAHDQIAQINLSGALQLSGVLALEGGDQGPVAIRITPSGGRALVLNEVSSTLTIVDLTSGLPALDFSLPLGGSRPSRLILSHGGALGWISFSGSNEVRVLHLHLFIPEVSPPLPIAGLNDPRGIAIQP